MRVPGKHLPVVVTVNQPSLAVRGPTVLRASFATGNMILRDHVSHRSNISCLALWTSSQPIDTSLIPLEISKASHEHSIRYSSLSPITCQCHRHANGCWGLLKHPQIFGI